MNDDILKLYKSLQKDGYGNLGTSDEFRERLKDENNRKKLYDSLTKDGYGNLGTFEEFSGRLTRPMADQTDAVRLDAPSMPETVGTPAAKPDTIAPVLDKAIMPTVELSEPVHEDVRTDFNDEPAVLGRLSAAQRELEDIERQLSEKGKAYANIPVAPGAPATFGPRMADKDYRRLQAAAENKRQEIRQLQHLQEGKTNNFWTNIGDVFADPNTWTFGLAGMDRSLISIDAADDDTRRSSQVLLGSMLNRQAAEADAEEERGFWGHAGRIAGQMVPFMVEIGMTGGLGNVAEAVEGKVAGMAGKYAEKKVVKALGTLAGDLASGVAMAGTIGAGHTVEGAINRKMGEIVEDEDGGLHMLDGYYKPDPDGNVVGDDGQRYTFIENPSWLTAGYKALMSQALEYSTERLGDHLQKGIGTAIAKRAAARGKKSLSPAVEAIVKNWDVDPTDFGLSAVSRDVSRGFGSRLAEKSVEYLNRMGIQGYPFEGIEEEANIIFNAALVGDNKFSDLWDKEQQADIWGGMFFSAGVMQAVPFAVSVGADAYNAGKARRYTKISTDMEKAADNASALIGERWSGLRDHIDSTENGSLADLETGIMDSDEYTQDEKSAICDYIHRLETYRGFNNVTAAQAREAIEQGPEGSSTDEIPGQMDAAYLGGYNAGDEQQNDIRNSFEFQKAALKEKTGLDSVSPDNVMELLQSENWSPEQKQAVLDYMMAAEAKDGMIQAVRDDISRKITTASTTIDRNTSKTDGMVHPAAMKDGRNVYIVDGTAVMTQDGTMVDHTKSQQDLLVRDAETGQLFFASVDQLQSVDDALDPIAEKQAIAEQIRRSLAQDAADRIDGILPFNPGDTYSLLTDEGHEVPVTVAMNEQGVVDNGDGTVNVVVNNAGAEGSPVLTNMPKDQIQAMVDASRMATIQRYADELQAAREARERLFSEKRSDVDEGQGPPPPGAAGSPVIAQPEPAVQEEQVEEQPVIPVDEKGRKQYMRAPAQATYEDIYSDDSFDSDEEAYGFLSGKVKRAEQALKQQQTAVDKVKPENYDSPAEYREAKNKALEAARPFQEAYDYWKGVKDLADADVNAANERTARMESEEEKALAQPKSVEDVAANSLNEMGRRLDMEDFKKETGLTDAQAKKFFPFWAKDGKGVKVQELAETIAANDQTGLAQDPQAVKDAIVAVMRSASRPSDIYDYTRNANLARAQAPAVEQAPVQETAAAPVAQAVAEAEAQVNTEPTDGQKEAGNYRMGHVKVDGFDISIENPKGSVRRGTSPDGKAWETKMNNTYGYIRRTAGKDGDHIDVFLSDNPDQGNIFVVDQVDPKTGQFDEHKVMYGFGSAEEARAAYLSNYEKGWQGLGNITEVTRDEFKKWVDSSHRKTKPFAEYKSVKPVEQTPEESYAARKKAVLDQTQARLDELQPRMDQVSSIAENDALKQEKVNIVREMLEALGAENMTVQTRDTVLGQCKADGASKRFLKDIEDMLTYTHEFNLRLRGFRGNGKVYIIADDIDNAIDALTTYLHENKHLENLAGGVLEKGVATGVSRAEMFDALRNLTGTQAYDNCQPHAQVDEILANAEEIAETEGIDAIPEKLRDAGIQNENFITFVQNNIRDGRQAKSDRRNPSGRDSRDDRDGQGNSRQDGRNPGQGSGEVGEPRPGSDEGGRQGTEGAESGDLTPEQKQDIIDREGVSSIEQAALVDGSGVQLSIRTEADVERKIRDFAKTKEAKKLGWTPDTIEDIISETADLIRAIHAEITGNKYYDEWAQRNPTVKVDWRDGVEKPTVTWSRANIEYKYDMSADLLCINNEGLETVLASPTMVDLMLKMTETAKDEKEGFTSDDYLRLYETLRDMGFVVPCKGCFDAAMRLKMLPSVSRKFVDLVNKTIDERNADPEAFDESVRAMAGKKKTTVQGFPAATGNKADAVRVGVAGDKLTEHISWAQLMSAEGQTKALADWGGIFRAWQKTGAGRPKDKLLPEPWYGDIVSSTTTIIGKFGEKTPSYRDIQVNQGTGLRRNSHSEFRPLLAIDEIQFMREAFIRGLTVFKYMKELDDVRLFGQLGVKFNMSFFPAFVEGAPAAGLDVNGDYIAAEESVGGREFEYVGEDGKTHYDGMKGWQEAQKYLNKDVSLSSVVFSIPHLIKTLTDVPTAKDPTGMWGSLIPFHASGATAGSLKKQGLGEARAIGVGHGFEEAMTDYDKGVTNFEAVQNDRFGEGWEILAGEKAGETVEPGHKLEFSNGTHYYNKRLGLHLFSSFYIYDNELKPEHFDKNGNVDSKKAKKAGHPFVVDYNDKVREIGTDTAYQDAADFYIRTLREIGLVPRFDFEVPEETFLKMCADAKVDPNHPKLGWKGAGNSWSPVDSDAYYSLFCDYGMIDPETGKMAPHNPVGVIDENGNRVFRLPDNAIDIIREGVERYGARKSREEGRVLDAIGEFAKRTVAEGKLSQEDADAIINQAREEAAQTSVITEAEGGEESGFRPSIRSKEPPKNTDTGYKVFFLKDGKLYPPMVANPDGAATPVGVWLDADAAPVAGVSKTGRKKVQAGGKGTQGGSGQLSYRPGWHLGTIPYALQFNRGPKVDNPLGITNQKGEVIKVGEFFPKDFVWAEVEYAKDKDYQEEAMSYGYNENGNFEHAKAGLPRIPKDGSYLYRTNANPATDPWIITGAMRVKSILTPSQVDDLVRKAGREPQKRQEGAITDEQIKNLNDQLFVENPEPDGPNGGTRFSITAKQDKEYMDAVNSGDMEKAGQMVREAFKAAFPNTKVVDENGEPLMVFHGTQSSDMRPDFYEFSAEIMNNGRTFGDGYYFTDSRELANKYARRLLGSMNGDIYETFSPRVIPAYLNIENMVDVEAGEGLRNRIKGQRIRIWNEIGRMYDGLVVRNIKDGYDVVADTYLVRDNRNIKSAEPVTYDDNGNVIPLSERFNPENNDIRFSVKGDDVERTALDLYDRYNNQDGEEYPWMSESELISRIEEELPYGLRTKNIFSKIDEYRRLDEEDFNEGRRDFSGSEKDDVFNEILSGLKELSEGGNPRFSVKNNEEYMSAVESGDTDKAQELVDKAAEDAGYRIRGYHGTTHNFNIFDRRKGNAEGNWGKGFYFTNNLDDAQYNYANEDGPDLTNRIEMLAEKMEWMDGYEGLDYEERLEKAREMLAGDDPHVISAAIRMENPLILDSRGGQKETYFDYDPGYNYETDEYEDEPSGLLVDFINAWNDVLNGSWEWDGNNIPPDEILDYADYDGLTASQLESKALEILDNSSIMNSEGEIASGEFLRQVFERMGFDGIVDNNVNQKFGTQRKYGRSMDGMDYGTAHIIAFRPEQIKQTDPVTYDDAGNVIPLAERFNPDSEDIRFSIKVDPETEKLFDAAKERFGTTRDLREAGYILPDGTLLDFSGRHWQGPKSDTSWMNGMRQVDHRDIADLEFERDGNTPTGLKTDMSDFIRRGAIRINMPGSINLYGKPTPQQRPWLQRLINSDRSFVRVDFGDGYHSDHYADYENANPSKILFDIDGYFDDGIKPEGNAPMFSITNRNQDVFVSNAEASIDRIKMEKATPEQWVKMLEKEGGLKAGEDKWLGLSDWLKSQDKKTLTKQEIADYIAENRIQIEEARYAERPNNNLPEGWYDAFTYEYDEYSGQRSSSIINFKKALELYNEFHPDNQIQRNRYGDIETEDLDKIEEFGQEMFENSTLDESEINPTRLNLTTEGLENKREIALVVPTVDPYHGNLPEIHFDDSATGGRAVAWIRFGDTTTKPEGSGLYSRGIMDELERKYGNARAYEKMSDEDVAKAYFADYVYRGDRGIDYQDYKRMFMADDLGDERAERVYPIFERMVKDAGSQGSRVLVIDEIQSQRHQDGREKGYTDKDAVKKAKEELHSAAKAFFDNEKALMKKYGLEEKGEPDNIVQHKLKNAGATEEEISHYRELYDKWGKVAGELRKLEDTKSVPSAPFEKNWHELAMKRMLRLAAEEGYDYVAWTTGDQQAERYGMKSAIGKLYASRDGEKYYVEVYDPEGNEITFNGLIGDSRSTGTYTAEELVNIFGKEGAKEIVSAADALPSEEEVERLREKAEASGAKEDRDAWRKARQAEIDGSELFKGEGMKGFYDDILPRFMNKYGKKWGVKVSDITLPNVEEAGRVMHAVPVTQEMKESVMQGQPMFSVKGDLEKEIDAASVRDELSRSIGRELTEKEASSMMDFLDSSASRIPESVEYSKEEFGRLFGNGVDTPMGRVKMGENQFEKFGEKNRDHQMALAYETLTSPDTITEKPSRAKGGKETERPYSLVYIKTFKGDDGETITYYNSVSAKVDGLEVVVSNYEPKSRTRVKREYKEGKLAYIKEVTLPSESATSTQGDQNTVPGGANSSGNKGSDNFGNSKETGKKPLFSILGRPVEEIVNDGKMKIAEENDEARAKLNDRMRAIDENLAKLRMAAAAQREYDRETVRSVTDLAKRLLSEGALSDPTRQEIQKLLTVTRWATGRKDLTSAVDAIMNLMVGNQLRHARGVFEGLLKIRGSKVDARGVEVQGKLDIPGQRLLQVFKDAMDMSPEAIDELIAAAEARLDSADDTMKAAAGDELVGLRLAREYVDSIRDSIDEEKGITAALREAAEDRKEGKLSGAAYREYAESSAEAIRQNRIERINAYNSIAGRLGGRLYDSIARGKAFREEEAKRIERIHHFANSDLEGKKTDEHGEKNDRLANNGILRFLLKPLATFDQMLRYFGGKSVNGEGYLWNHFMRGWVDANDAEYKGMRAATDELDRKVSEVFGRKMRWSDLYSVERKMPTVEVKFWDGGKMKDHVLTQGNLLYIYMVNKMSDGRMKLRRMGIEDEHVQAIKEQMDPRFIELADWLQDEFLVNLRNKYNRVHEKLFGAPMAAIENYFPLKVLANARVREVDMSSPDTDGTTPSTITGSIIKRRRNSLALDVLGTDAFSLVIEHLEQMEHWAAFASFNQDLNTLLSYKTFRNKVQNMSSIYGAGSVIWENFRKSAEIAAGVYRPAVSKDSVDKTALNIAKGVTAAKISFRVYTAIKQLLSMPAFISDANVVQLGKSLATPWKSWNWAIEELPGFQKRWLSRQAGDTRLMKTDSDWKMWRNNIVTTAGRLGMSPNAFVDALTVSIGAKAMYETRKKKYLDDGYTEEQAEKRAKQDATILFNETQQSNEAAYLSAMQLDRTWASVALTVFRNSSMGYQRQLVDAVRNIGRKFQPGYKETAVEFMTKQMVRDGIDEEDARDAAERNYSRSTFRDALRVAVFGFVMQFAWNLGKYLPYLLAGGDDDEKKKMLKDAARQGLIGGTVEGLTGGSVISEAANMLASGESLKNYDPTLMPVTSDIQRIIKMASYDQVAAANEVVNLLVQSGIGVNPQTITDIGVAIYDACHGDPKTTKEATLLLMRILQCPQSQVDKVYIDELDLTAEKGLDLSISEFAKRYADYKVRRGAATLGWMYSDENREKRVDSYEKKFTKQAKDLIRTRGNDVDRAYYEYVDTEHKEVEATLRELRSATRNASESGDQMGAMEYAQAMNDFMQTPEYQRYARLHGNVNAIKRLQTALKKADDRSRDAVEDQILQLKRQMVDELNRTDNK